MAEANAVVCRDRDPVSLHQASKFYPGISCCKSVAIQPVAVVGFKAEAINMNCLSEFVMTGEAISRLNAGFPGVLYITSVWKMLLTNIGKYLQCCPLARLQRTVYQAGMLICGFGNSKDQESIAPAFTNQCRQDLRVFSGHLAVDV